MSEFVRRIVAGMALLGGLAPAVAEPVPVRVVTQCCQFEPVAGDAPDISSIDRYLFEHSGAMTVRVDYLNRSRGWRYVTGGDNVCATRIRKTPDRQSVSHFTRLPHSIYPPYRLVMLKDSARAVKGSAVLLEAWAATDDVTIGLIGAYRYGEPVARARAMHPESFMELPTVNQVDQILIKALEAGRVDAIVADSWTVAANIALMREDGQTQLSADDVSALAIEGTTANLGYIACSNTPAGARIVDVLDQTLSRPDVQRTLLDVHKAWFPPAESAFLRDTFSVIYGLQVP